MELTFIKFSFGQIKRIETYVFLQIVFVGLSNQ